MYDQNPDMELPLLPSAFGGIIVGLSTGYLVSKVILDMEWKQIIAISIGWSIAWSIGLVINYRLYDEYGSSFTIWFFSFLVTTAIVGFFILAVRQIGAALSMKGIRSETAGSSIRI